MLKKLIMCMLLVCSSIVVAAAKKDDGSQIQPDNYYPKVKMQTSMGDIIVELDRKKAPITVNNFLRYVDQRSYEGNIFHRVIEGFVVQGGGYDSDMKELPKYPPIFNESGNGMKNVHYSIAMAKESDPQTARRQFFFNVADNDHLDPGRNWGYAVFGAVVEGYEVVDKMAAVKTEYKPRIGWNDVPIEPILLQKVTIIPE